VVGFVPNPYFAGATPSTIVEPFSHRAHDIYLVTTAPAIIYAAVYDMHQASAELSAAVTADPTLVNRAEIQKLQQQLAARKL
jgi:hypothetical protein